MSKILAVDTATGSLSVCIFDSNSSVLSFTECHDKESQAEKLVPTIEKCLLEAKLTYNDIDIFSACLGPGSFTGIRIGLSAAKAMAYSLHKNFSGVTSLEATAQRYKKPCNILLNANRNEAYFQSFNETKPSEPELINLDNLKEYSKKYSGIFIADKVEIIAKLKDSGIDHHNQIVKYSAQDIAEFLNNQKVNLRRKSPVYIRKPDAKIPTRKLNIS